MLKGLVRQWNWTLCFSSVLLFARFISYQNIVVVLLAPEWWWLDIHLQTPLYTFKQQTRISIERTIFLQHNYIFLFFYILRAGKKPFFEQVPSVIVLTTIVSHRRRRYHSFFQKYQIKYCWIVSITKYINTCFNSFLSLVYFFLSMNY